MLVEATAVEADAITRAMRDVATASATLPLTDADRAAVAAAHHYVFRAQGDIDVATLPPIAPADLAATVQAPRLREHTVGFLAVMATVDGTVDTEKIRTVEDYAHMLGTQPEEVRQLAAAAEGKLQWVTADMTRQNMRSITGRDFDGDVNQWLQPYAAAPDADLNARYAALGALPAGTFGRTWAEFYSTQGFAFPGDPAALNERFATPHDSAHVLSGYSTSPQGELLVSTFTAGMHPHEPVSGHILPVIFSWHLGVLINDVAGRFTGALEPEKFFVAWTRGSALTTDTFDATWDFWTAVEVPLEQLRARYEVPPLDSALAAEDTMPLWYHPIA